MPFSYLGRMFIGAGLVLIVIGAVFVFASRAGLPLGRLPGDVTYKGSRFTFFAPLGTSLLLSVLLSLLVYLIMRFRR